MFDNSNAVENTRIHSYLFFAAELPAGQYTRTYLSSIARAINKPLPMPALVLIRHGDALSVAILHRRLNKRETDKDVLEKATLIKDIAVIDPIRAHLEILNEFALANLDAEFGIHNFVSLHNAWQKRLATSALNDRFYTEIANWYFWAKKLIAEGKVLPPRDVDTDPERSLFLIRLLTRLIFCWFLLEKRLLPPALFREKDLGKLLADLAPNSPTFYRAVLQNLFFGTLNQPADERGFRKRTASGGRDPNRGITNLWRYADLFCKRTQWEELAKNVPFLNGGLFDCLDRIYEKADDAPNTRLDGFSDNPKEAAALPNYLFFDDTGRTVDLSSEFDDEKKANARSRKTPVRGLIQILTRYKFTVEENTPLDEEIALDPELLGKVFENLLASYNPETRDTARKALGAFYTPREVVSFMVDEALIAYLEPILNERGAAASANADRLHDFFHPKPDSPENPFTDPETDHLVDALDDVKILDPACGSGAFPMGALQRLVNLLARLDPHNERWQARQRTRLADDRAAASKTADPQERVEKLADLQRWEDELNVIFDTGRFHPDYARKVFLIENAIFGADIQPVAVQIAKLRFFIALISDQKTEASTRPTPLPLLENFGVLPLPNLETRIVAANTLLPVGRTATGRLGQADLLDQRVDRVRAELRQVHHDHFQARTLARKRRCRERDAALRAELASILRGSLPADRAEALATTNLFDQNSSSPFFEPAWMFSHPSPRGGHSAIEGFDIVVGNPPYVRQEKIKDQKEELRPHYPETYSGTADLYVYFYDRALQLLRSGGILSFITSNSFLNSAFGEKLRAHLAKTTRILVLIDFAEAKVFTAITEPCIFIAKKETPGNSSFKALRWDEEKRPDNIRAEFVANAFSMPQIVLSNPPWQIEVPRVRKWMDKLVGAGPPLGKFVNNRFCYGIKTGLNEAFIIEREKRDEIARDKKSAAFLKPFLRGKDLRRWKPVFADQWLIVIPSSENATHPWSGQKSAEAEKTFQHRLPAIYEHFRPLRAELIARADQGHYYWELRSCAYYEEFAKPKVIYQEINRTDSYAYDASGLYMNNKLFMLPEAPIWLLGILNSPVAAFFLHRSTGVPKGGFLALQWPVFSPLPVAAPDAKQKKILTNLVHLAMQLTDLVPTGGRAEQPRDPMMRDYYEELLNALVYELYLPEELHAAGLRMFDRVTAAGLPALDAPLAANARGGKADSVQAARHLTALREKFEELHAPTHALRAALQKLHTLEPIRIIEGKA